MNVQIGERLEAERKRLLLNQDQMAALGGVAKRTYCNYESGEREPGCAFLEALTKVGVDAQFVITGQRAASNLPSDEVMLLERYRASPPSLRDAAIRVLLGGAETSKAKHAVTQVFHTGVDIGQHIQGDQTYNQPVSITVGGSKKKK